VTEPSPRLRALVSAAASAQRSLETRIVRIDSAWNDGARRSFEAEHLAPLRGEARHLRDELADIAADLDRAVRNLDR